ncbi:leucine-rich repeat neuronal protein 4 [Parambassis ranga]|uniref:Leucine-rich repeat neuronal protein 4 n=1 Tax=Parambassis ranga TaxID=210632 RepID=A0A6P7JN04_9TELE|nr:leucine-rich repeat neuronal protein 4-like [Parambassis ranga]
MAAAWDLSFPLIIICLVFIRSYCSLPTASQDAEVYSMRPLRPRRLSTESLNLPSDDYYDDVDTVSPVIPIRVSPNEQTFKPCDYSPCTEGQTPCPKLSAATGCLCPGFTLHDTPPEAPNLRSVSWNGSDVVLQWCAPYSHVIAYVVTVGGQERQAFREDKRSGAVGAIDHISQVCIVAVNEAGPSDGTCMMYQPKGNRLPLTAGLIGGALGLLLLVLLAVLLWRHRRQRKYEASISMHSAAESQ